MFSCGLSSYLSHSVNTDGTPSALIPVKSERSEEEKPPRANIPDLKRERSEGEEAPRAKKPHLDDSLQQLAFVACKQEEYEITLHPLQDYFILTDTKGNSLTYKQNSPTVKIALGNLAHHSSDSTNKWHCFYVPLINIASDNTENLIDQYLVFNLEENLIFKIDYPQTHEEKLMIHPSIMIPLFQDRYPTGWKNNNDRPLWITDKDGNQLTDDPGRIFYIRTVHYENKKPITSLHMVTLEGEKQINLGYYIEHFYGIEETNIGTDNFLSEEGLYFHLISPESN